MKKTLKYYGFYRGSVQQCLNNGFCRIQIPGILDRVNDDVNSLPLAEPAQSLGGGGIDTNNGKFMYPDKNSIVWCFFEGGNVERPIYFATSFMKSSSWNDIMVPTPKNENNGNDGYTVMPSGILTKFNRSSIKQDVVFDTQTNQQIADKIDIKVDSTAEQDTLRNQTMEMTKRKEKKGITNPAAASIHLDNKRNIVTLMAKNAIVLHAPNIIIDSTGFEQPGYVLIKSDETDNLTDNGPFRVLSSVVNIDAGVNDIILQTRGEIHHIKSTQAKSKSKKANQTVKENE